MKRWTALLLTFLLAPTLHSGPAALAAASQAEATDAAIAAYTKFQEWHFELHLTDAEQAQYQAFLRSDLGKGNLRQDVNSAPQIVARLAGSDWLDIAKFHSDQRQADGVDRSATEMLANGTVSGNGIWANTLKEAKRGIKSSGYLLRLVDDAEKPLAGSGNVHDSLFPRQVNALFDWTAFRFAMVTGSPSGFDSTEAGRAAFRQMMIASWKRAQRDPGRFSELQDQVSRAGWNWVVWRIADYGHFKRLSPFQQKVQLAEWSAELVPAMPWLRETAQRRLSELKAYIAKMPDSEVRAEFQRKQRADAKFAVTIRKMQSESAGALQTANQMRQSMVAFHTANLNIAENLGNSGYVWTVGPRR